MRYLQPYEGRASWLLNNQQNAQLLFIHAVMSYSIPFLIIVERRKEWKKMKWIFCIVLVRTWLEMSNNLKFVREGYEDLDGEEKFSPHAIQVINSELDDVVAMQSGQTICYCLSALLTGNGGVSSLPIVLREIPTLIRLGALVASMMGLISPHKVKEVFPAVAGADDSKSNGSDKMQLLVDMLVLPLEVRQIPNALKHLGSNPNNSGKISSKKSLFESFCQIASISLMANYIRVRFSSNLSAAKAVQLDVNSNKKNVINEHKDADLKSEESNGRKVDIRSSGSNSSNGGNGNGNGKIRLGGLYGDESMIEGDEKDSSIIKIAVGGNMKRDTKKRKGQNAGESRNSK